MRDRERLSARAERQRRGRVSAFPDRQVGVVSASIARVASALCETTTGLPRGLAEKRMLDTSGPRLPPRRGWGWTKVLSPPGVRAEPQLASSEELREDERPYLLGPRVVVVPSAEAVMLRFWAGQRTPAQGPQLGEAAVDQKVEGGGG